MTIHIGTSYKQGFMGVEEVAANFKRNSVDPKYNYKLKNLQKYTAGDLARLESYCRALDIGKTFEETVEKLKEKDVKDTSGLTMPWNKFRAILSLYSMVSYSSYLTIKQKDSPGYSTLVPIPLAAFRAERGRAYSEWDWENIHYGVIFIGKFLYDTLQNREEIKEEWLALRELPQDTINQLRLESCRLNRRGSDIDYYSLEAAWSPRTIKEDETSLDLGIVKMYNKLNRGQRVMLLQSWIAHENYRHPDMILDLFELDTMPKWIPDTAQNIYRQEMETKEWGLM